MLRWNPFFALERHTLITWKLGCLAGQKKICLKAEDEGVFAELMRAADKEQIPGHIVRDAGHTQIPSGSQTVLALGPYDEEHLDKITGHLKLL